MTATKFQFIIITIFTFFLSSQYSEAEEGNYYKINDVKMPIKDHTIRWDSDKKELAVIFTPSTLNEDEKKLMITSPFVFSPPSFKKSPNTDIWQEYPSVKMTLLFESDEISQDTIEDITITTYGVEGKNANITFTIYKRDLNLEELSYDEDKLKIKLYGKKDFRDEKNSWNIEL